MYCSNLYCSSFWFDSSKTAMNKIKIAYNNSLRRLLSLPKHNSASEMFVNLNILSFGELLRKFVYSFQSRVMMSDNILLSGIFNSTYPAIFSHLGLVIYQSYNLVLYSLSLLWVCNTCFNSLILLLIFILYHVHSYFYMDQVSEINIYTNQKAATDKHSRHNH